MRVSLHFIIYSLMVTCNGNLTSYIVPFCRFTGITHGLGTFQHECHISVPRYLKETTKTSIELTKWRPWTKQTQINGFLCQSVKILVTCTTSFFGSREITEVPHEVYVSSKECYEAPIQLERSSTSPDCEWWSSKTITETFTIKRPVWGTLLRNGTVFFPEIGRPISIDPNYHAIESLILVWSKPTHEYYDYSCHYVPIGSVHCTKTQGITEDDKPLVRYNCTNEYITFVTSTIPTFRCTQEVTRQQNSIFISTSGEYVSESKASSETLSLTIGNDMLQDEINHLKQELFALKYQTLCSQRNTMIRTIRAPSLLTPSEMRVLYGLHASIGLYKKGTMSIYNCDPGKLNEYSNYITYNNSFLCYNSTAEAFVPSTDFECDDIRRPITLRDGIHLNPNNSISVDPEGEHNRFYVYPEIEAPKTQNDNSLLSPSKSTMEGYHSVIYRNPLLSSLTSGLDTGSIIRSIFNLVFWIIILYLALKGSKLIVKIIGRRRNIRKYIPNKDSTVKMSQCLMSVED